MHRRPVYIYLFNVPSFSSRHFNKIKRTSRLGRLLALSLEILIMSGQHTQDTCTLLQYTPIVYKYLVRLDNFRALNYRKVLSLWDSASIKQPSSQCPLKVRSLARIGDTHVEGTQENRLDEPLGQDRL